MARWSSLGTTRLPVGQISRSAAQKATTFEELLEGAKSLPWADWIPVNGAFPVEGTSVDSTLRSVHRLPGDGEEGNRGEPEADLARELVRRDGCQVSREVEPAKRCGHSIHR